MTWNPNRKAKELYAHSDLDRINFYTGYSDAYFGFPMWSGSERNWHPEAYKEGYNAGLEAKNND